MNTEPERFEIPSAPKGIRGKILAWIKRFLPAELIGSGLAIAASNLTLYLTHNKVIAAYVAATADTIGFYMVITLQSVLALRRQLHHSSQKFSLRHTWQVFKNLLLEFGPAELLDSLLLRPFFMYIFPILLHNYATGIVTGKIVSDICFYIPVVIISQLRVRYQEKRSKSDKQ